MSERKVATVFTHRRPTETSAALGELVAAARSAGYTLRFSPEETIKHGLKAEPGIEVDAPPTPDADICVVLGGDGTILHGLRTYARTGVPVFGVNFGEVGFLATIDPDDVAAGLRQAFRGDFETLSLPGIEAQTGGGAWLAMNDVSFHRQQGLRVADLAVEVGEEEVGRVRCDGLVVATPAGSTGYNLANQGPILAWGVKGYAVSYIAPHSLTARALVVAPADVLTVFNAPDREPVEIALDGMEFGFLESGDDLKVHFVESAGRLAQLPGTSFYGRIRDKFGHLAV